MHSNSTKINNAFHSKYLLPFALLAVLLSTFFIYQPGFTGLFLFDDEYNIIQNQGLHIQTLTLQTLYNAAMSSDSGPLKRPVSMVSFALNEYYGGGLNAYSFKYINTMVHLLNGIIVFVLTRLLLAIYAKRYRLALTDTRIDWAGLAVAAVWLLHPLNLTPVLYVVQRMTSLAALFSFCAISGYLWSRYKHLNGQFSVVPILFSFLVFLPLAVLSKENALVTPILIGLIEWLILDFYAPNKKVKHFVLAIFFLTAIAPIVAGGAYILTHIDWLINGFDQRPFTLYERVLTEPRVLWSYLFLYFVPGLSRFGIHHDDIPLSSALFAPSSTFFSIAGILLLIGVAIALRRKAPLLSMGILFYFVGHGLESTIFSLEIAHEHRNYLPVYGVTLAMIYYLIVPMHSQTMITTRQVAAIALIAILGTITAMRASLWGDPTGHLLLNAQNHPNSSRSNSGLGRMYYSLAVNKSESQQAEEFYQLTKHYYQKAYELDPAFLTALVSQLMLDSVLKKTMDIDTINSLTKHLRRDYPIQWQTIRAIQDFHQCIRASNCLVPDNLLDILFSATLSNTAIKRSQKAVIMGEASQYKFDTGNNKQGLELAEQAKNTNPSEPQHWLNLIQIYSDLGRQEDARQTVQQFEPTQAATQVSEKLARLKSTLALKYGEN